MHVKILYRKALYVFLSLMIVISSTQSAYAASPAGWVAQSALVEGATATVTAIKGGGATAMQAVVTHTPTAVSIGKEIVKVGGVVAVAYAVNEIVGAGVDWVLDPANNRVVYQDGTTTEVGSGQWYYNDVGGHVFVSDPAVDCKNYSSSAIPEYTTISSGAPAMRCRNPSGGVFRWYYKNVTYEPVDKYVPYSTVAGKIASNAAAGHSPSQSFIKNVAINDVNTGVIDSQLDDAAVPADPYAPTDPVDPSVPFDPSSIIAALQSLMSAIDNMATGLKRKMDTMLVEIGLMQQETNQVINDGMADVVAANQATEAKVGDVVAAIEALEGNMLDGQVINDAVDRVIAEGKTNTADIVAAIEAIEGNTLDGQVINDAVDRVIENDNSNAQSAAEAAEAAEAARTAADAANTAAVTDAIDAQTDAISQTDPDTGEKSLKLPTFCGWAGTVCEYMDWVKGEYQTTIDWFKTEPAPPPAEPVAVIDDVDIGNWQEKANAGYVQFGGQCPTDVNIPINYMGASTNLSISYAPFCQFASMIKPAVILGAWISAMLIISGGRARES